MLQSYQIIYAMATPNKILKSKPKIRPQDRLLEQQ